MASNNDNQEVQPVEMATEFITMEEWNIWLALNGELGEEAAAEAGAIMDARIAEEEGK
jgi:hypothetical protein